MENEIDFRVLLPDTVKPTELEEPVSVSNYLEASVGRVRLKAGKIKYAIEDVLQDIWQAHEVIVRYPTLGWSWRRYCNEIGVAHVTPIRWFQKYGLDYTVDSKFTPQHVLEGGTNVPPRPPKPAKLVGLNPPEVILDEGLEQPTPIPVVRPVEHPVTEMAIEQAVERKEFVPEALKRLKTTLNKALTPEVVDGIKKKIEKPLEADEEKTEEQKRAEAHKKEVDEHTEVCNDALFSLQKSASHLERPKSSRVLIELARIAKSLPFNINDILPKGEQGGSMVADHVNELWDERKHGVSLGSGVRKKTHSDLLEIREFAKTLIAKIDDLEMET